MKQWKYLLGLLLIFVTISGCGGGGGKKSTTGTVTGMLTLGSTVDAARIGGKTNQVKFAGQGSFPKVSFRRSQLTTSSIANEKIVKLRPGLSEVQAQQVIMALGATIKRKIYGPTNMYVIKTDSTSAQSSDFTNNTDIVYVQNNHIFYAQDTTVTPNDTDYSEYQSWNYTMLNLPKAWSIQKGNSNVVVAVIDSGVATSHPDLMSNLVSGYDFVSNDSDPSDNTYYNGKNRYSHGTHVAGIISAVTNNGLGVAGVGWNVKIMPVRVLENDGSGSEDAIISGIQWAVDHGANIINLSIGGEFTAAQASQALKDALQNALNNNVTIVAAAGNEGHYVDFPANYPGVIAVSAVDANGRLTSYSNYGSEIWVGAPGGDANRDDITSYVYSLSYDKLSQANGYIGMAGTSMACPHISGLAALLYSRGVKTPSKIRERLKTNSTGFNIQTGYGVPDAFLTLLGTAKVFYVLADGTCGTMKDARVGSSYSVSRIPPGQAYVCAFVDTDADGQVSTGDLFAFKGLTSTAGVVTTQDLTLEKVTISPAKPISVYISEYIKAGFQ